MSFDVASFREIMANQIAPVEGASEPAAPAASRATGSEGVEQFLHPLAKLNDQLQGVKSTAFEQLSNSQELKPSDLIALQVEVHKFSFQTHLTTNVADKGSKGIQQLFRQQG